MSHFEFLMVLASIVVAVAMTEVMAGIGRLIRTRRRVTFDWLHLGWTYVVLLFSMIYWYGMWPYQTVEFVYVAQIWLLVFPTLFLVIVAFALSPDTKGEENLGVREYFLENRGPIFIGLSAFMAMAWFADFALTGNIYPESLAVTVGFIAIFSILAISTKYWLQVVLLVLVAVFLTSMGFLEVAEQLTRFDE